MCGDQRITLYWTDNNIDRDRTPIGPENGGNKGTDGTGRLRIAGSQELSCE